MQLAEREEFDRQLQLIMKAYYTDRREIARAPDADRKQHAQRERELRHHHLDKIQAANDLSEALKTVATARFRRMLATDKATEEPENIEAEALLFENIERLSAFDEGRDEIRATYEGLAFVYSLRALWTGDASVKAKSVPYFRKSLEYRRMMHPNEISSTLSSMARNLPPILAVGVWEVVTALDPVIFGYRVNRAKQLAAAGHVDELRHESDHFDPDDLEALATAVAACKVLGRHKRARTLALAGVDQAEAQSLPFWAEMFRTSLNRKN